MRLTSILTSLTLLGLALDQAACLSHPRLPANARMLGEFELPARQAAQAGVDYAEAYRQAKSGDSKALSVLFKVTDKLDGAGAEEHSGNLQGLLKINGDTAFAAVLAAESKKVREAVIDALDFGFIVIQRQQNWSKSFPSTYRLGLHPHELLYRHPPGQR